MRTTLDHNMTLRLSEEMDSMIAEAAYGARNRQSKADFIRGAIRQRLGRAWQAEPSLRNPAMRGSVVR
jgi:Arc/MetJ-type ribon-helix-helix transcriptional regulator